MAMHSCRTCKFYVRPLNSCSLVNSVVTGSHDCTDYEEEVYISPSQYRYWDAITNIKLIGTEGFQAIPRTIRGFFSNHYLIGVVEGMAVFYVPWLQEDYRTRMRILKIDTSLQVFTKVNEEDNSSSTGHSSLIFVTRGVLLGPRRDRRDFLKSLGLSFTLTTHNGEYNSRHYSL